MSDRPGLIDANVLVYAIHPDSEHHIPSRRLLESETEGRSRFCVTSQVLGEFFATVTNPRRVSVAKTVLEAADAVESILSLDGISVLASPHTVPFLWVDLLKQRPVASGRTFDLQTGRNDAGKRRAHHFHLQPPRLHRLSRSRRAYAAS